MGKAINELDNSGSITDATLVPVGETDTLKKTTWATIKATLKTYFDSLYLAVTGGTITDTTSAVGGASAGSALTVNQTWNTTGTPTALKVDVTDTASNAASLLMDLRVGGVSRFRVDKTSGLSYYVSSINNYSISTAASKTVIAGSRDIELSPGSGWGVNLLGASGVCISGSGNTFIHSESSSTLALRNSTNAQTFRLYNTYTDASNYQRASFATSSTAIKFSAESAGTGAANIDLLLEPKGTGSVVVPKASGTGIKVDTTTPTWGWRDITGDITVRGTGSNDPTFATFIGGIRAYSFSATVMNECFICFHIPHDYVPGTDIYLHAHWANVSATPNTGDVIWGFEYSFAKGFNQAAFPSTTTVTVTQACPATRYQHNIAETAAVTISSLEVDGLLMVRVYRDAAAGGDTCTDAVSLLTADVHYQSTNLATKAKAPNFYS